MALSLSKGCRDGLANTQGFSELFSGGTLKIMTGAAPGIEYGVTGSELLSVESLSFASAGSGGVYMQQGGTIGGTGTAGYFRLSSADDNPVANAAGTAIRAEGTCGMSDSSDLLFNGLQMTAGVYKTIHGNFRILT